MVNQESELEAIVEKVVTKGQRSYVVTFLAYDHPRIGLKETITFSINDWQGELEPRKSQKVLLSSIQAFENGWRALSARPIEL